MEFMEKSHFRVYACLDFHRNKNNKKAWPKIDTMKKETKLSRATIFSALKDLEYWGLIKKEKYPGRVNKYLLPDEPNIRIPTLKLRKKFTKKRKRDRETGKFRANRENPSISMEQVESEKCLETA